MLLLKVYFHIIANCKILFYKSIYRNQLFLKGNFTFRKGFSLVIDKGSVNIGKDCFFNNYCTIASQKSITIGDGCLFGENVKIYDHNHIFNDISISIIKQGYTSAPIIIGKHCWIASNVVILKGITIGDNCVIGAGCILHKDIPSNSIVLNNQNLLINKY